jgi:hypothetical protein
MKPIYPSLDTAKTFVLAKAKLEKFASPIPPDISGIIFLLQLPHFRRTCEPESVFTIRYQLDLESSTVRRTLFSIGRELWQFPRTDLLS